MNQVHIHKLPQINHIDCNKDNNAVSNLEWCTQSQNIKHSYQKGHHEVPNQQGEKNSYAKLTKMKVDEIRSKYKPYLYTAKELSEEYGVKIETIRSIIKRRTWNY